MTAPQITPGPWDVDGFTIKQDGVTVAMAWPDRRVSSDDSLARMHANAKAIAAVPAMVEAGSAFLTAWNADNSSDDTIRAAVKLAEALQLAGIEVGPDKPRGRFDNLVADPKLCRYCGTHIDEERP